MIVAPDKESNTMGWKTILGTVLVAIGNTLKDLEDPIGMIGKALVFVGTVFFGTGLRHAIAKVGTILPGR